MIPLVSKYQHTEEKTIAFVFSKKAKEEKIEDKKIDDTEIVKKIIEVIEKLPPGSKKKLEDLAPPTNPKNWINTILNNSTPHNEIEVEKNNRK
ncbi:MAG: hypothetical protein QXJ27_05160 [Thermoplasmata archaeon]